MATRLDRLIKLLETGSTTSVRHAAAKQIGAIAASRQTALSIEAEAWMELLLMTGRVVPLLHSKSNDARMAAALALEEICTQAGAWDASRLIAADTSVDAPPLDSLLSLTSFNLYHVLSTGNPLLGSAGIEYKGGPSTEEDKTASRKMLKDLGIDDAKSMDLDSELDLDVKPSSADTSHLSAREKNALKRKRKEESTQANKQPRLKAETPAPALAKPKEEPAGNGLEDGKLIIASKKPTKIEHVEAPPGSEYATPSSVWPFTKILFRLADSLSDPNWEVRHGSLLGLSALLKTQGASMGHILGTRPVNNQIRKQQTAEHLAVAILTLLCLDRFSDFVGDSVLAPVREAGSRCLTQLSKHLFDEQRAAVQVVLEDMTRQEFAKPLPGGKKHIWQVRHAGLNGLRSLVQERTMDQMDQASTVKLVQVAMIGLVDNDDDVRLAAAETLLPAASEVAACPSSVLTSLFDTLFACLSDLQDDLSSSVGSIMVLLSSLLSQPKAMSLFSSRYALSDVVIQSYPYFRHTISSVRLAVLDMLQLLISKSAHAQTLITDELQSLLFQNLILEEKPDIADQSLRIALGLLEMLPSMNQSDVALTRWLSLLYTPIGLPYDPNLVFRPQGSSAKLGHHQIDKNSLKQDLALVSEERIILARLKAARFMGLLIGRSGTARQDQVFVPTLLPYFHSNSAWQRYITANLLVQWIQKPEDASETAKTTFYNAIVDTIDKPFHLQEAEPVFSVLLLEMRAVAAALSKHKVQIPQPVDSIDAPAVQAMLARFGQVPPAQLSKLNDLKSRLESASARASAEQDRHFLYTNAALACALVVIGKMPPKMNPVIKSFMNSIKFETMVERQQQSATHLAYFLQLCGIAHANKQVNANPAPKVVKNLATFLCSDRTQSPLYTLNQPNGILSLPQEDGANSKERDTKKVQPVDTPGSIIRRGAEFAIRSIAVAFGDQLFQDLPVIWELSVSALKTTFANPGDITNLPTATGQQILDNFSVLTAVCVSVTPEQAEKQIQAEHLWQVAANALCCSSSLIRNAAAKFLARLSQHLVDPALHFVVDVLLPKLEDLSVPTRRGISELLACAFPGDSLVPLKQCAVLVEQLELKILPYLIFFIAPVLARMTDADTPVRLIATQTFATLVKLVPLEAGAPSPPGFSAETLAKRDEQRFFIRQLIDGSKAEQYPIPIKVAVQLRPYQLEGVSWLAFLVKFKLHGCLCDDMGLGKTLQTIVMLASTKHEREVNKQVHLTSIVVCPPTLVAHWIQELTTYVSNLKAVQYSGSKAHRAALLDQLEKIDVLVMSYEVMRTSADLLKAHNYLFLVLDEGHVIKNPKTQIAQQVKRIVAQHRLILSGTPIQNHVLELWSLFDFLMPGFLGDEKAFKEKYSKKIAASRDAKASNKDQEAGTLALDALHKQILPFLLRRLKENVLDDLPPKIIQDYHAELSPFQRSLYEAAVNNAESEAAEESNEAKTHVFSSLQYLRKLVNHPLLALTAEEAANSGLNLHDLAQAPKLEALKQVLNDCGIGTPVKTEDADEAEPVAPHRALIFCQMKQTLDLIESDLFAALMPGVTYMRLDGDVPPVERHPMVQRFNSDPSIDCMLLTTHVGGLGLTLTGADTVIFVEHDWNPMKDLQAMDRAHRLGQKRVVNVYRLIMRDTIEEKIMGLQKFKLNIASSVVNDENSGMGTMDTDQVLDLFDQGTAPSKTDKAKGTKLTRKALLEGLGDLAEE